MTPECHQFDLLSLVNSGLATIVHANAGVTMVKASYFREAMPAGMLRLQRSWSCGRGGSMPRTHVCFFCSQSGEDHLREDPPLWTCPICMLTVHSSCSRKVAFAMADAKPSEVLPSAQPGAVLSVWQVCPCCAIFLKHDRMF